MPRRKRYTPEFKANCAPGPKPAGFTDEEERAMGIVDEAHVEDAIRQYLAAAGML